MNFQVGQKVSFLNEARSGKITKIINSQIVHVAIEDGFDIPVMVSELVSIDPLFTIEKDEDKVYIYQNAQPVKVVKTVVEEIEEDEEVPRKSYINLDARKEIELGYHLAFVAEENDINSEYFYVMFINNTDNDVIFKYGLKKEGNFVDIDYDRAESNTSTILEVISRSQFEEWSDISIQLFAFNEGKANKQLPFVAEAYFHPLKVFKGQNFKYYEIIEETAYIITLKSGSSKNNDDFKELKEKIETKGPKIVGHINDLVNKDKFPEKHLVSKEIAEVDLHIDELVEDMEGMTNVQMLSLQLNYFRKTLDSAITNHLKRIIFIHGVGNGKLKNSIAEILTTDYPFLEVFDASMAKYGVGATEIRIGNRVEG
ncbi:MAG: DUF2027 domain-containing protein [Bacteroidota bacterium]